MPIWFECIVKFTLAMVKSVVNIWLIVTKIKISLPAKWFCVDEVLCSVIGLHTIVHNKINKKI